MAKKSKKIIIIDVEGMSGKRPYNVGFLVADLKGNIYRSYSGAIMPCIWENLQSSMKTAQEKARDMTHKNIQEILSTPTKYKWETVEDFMNTFNSAIEEFNVSEIWAYNCNFDRNAISKLGDIKSKVSWFDIWSAIVMTKCLTKKYVKFCKNNGFVTDKGNCKTSAETVYAYLTNNNNFEEEHTGLSDCRIEYEILMKAKKTKKKIDGTLAQPWKLVKKFCEDNGL